MGTALGPETSAKPAGEGAQVAKPPENVGVRAAVLAKHFALAAALAASTVLMIDYRNAGDPAFCGVASGCFAVRVSAYSHLFGVPLPNLALPAFAILLGGSLLARTPEHHRLVAGAGAVAVVAAGALIAIQALAIGAFCPWCVIVDSSAIVAGVSALFLWLRVGESAERAREASLRPQSVAAWGVAGALAVALPFLWARYPVIPPPPAQIAAEARPGKVTVVSFTDFECPFCRKLHPLLDSLREKHGDRLQFVRKMKPLSGHPGAEPAARAYLCASPDKRDTVAAALYAAEPTELNEKKLAGLADKLDLGPRDAFTACMSSEATTSAIERDASLFKDVGGRGLPLTYVNARVIMGYNPDRLVGAIDEELGGERPSFPIAALYAILGLAFAAAAALSWRAPAAPAPAAAPRDPAAAPGEDAA